jgi:hypothetical protein
MISPVPPLAEGGRPPLPAPRTPEPDSPQDPELLTFADVEVGVVEDADLEEVLAVWDGFL